MKALFPTEQYSNINWDFHSITDEILRDLQTFWIFTQLQGLIPHSQGPDWASQKKKAAALAALGTQRCMGDSNRGLDHMFPPGLGVDKHMELAKLAKSPMSLEITLDEDLSFGVHAAAVWGPYIDRWRDKQLQHIALLLSLIHI